MEKVKITIYLAPETATTLRVEAAKRGGQSSISNLAEEILRAGLGLEPELGMVANLQDLTGRESGIVVYGSNGIICNWAGIEGLPMIAPTGLMGTGESVPEVAGAHADDLAPYLEGVEITNMTSGDGEIAGGTVYELGDDVLAITPDGWI